MTLKKKIRKLNLSTWISSGDTEKLVKIADEFAIDFAEWMSKYKFLPNKGWYQNLFDIEMDIFKTSKELLEIYKIENNL